MTAKPFLITGMPRCREAWLSVFMTTGNSLCYYDATLGLSNISDLKRLYESEQYKFVGVADLGLSFFLPWIMEEIKPRTVLLYRDTAEIAASTARSGNPITNLPELAKQEILKFKDHPLVMWVPYEAVSSKRVMQKIFWHLMPGEPFDEARYENLEKMHIGADLKESVQRYMARKPQMDHLLRDVLPRVKIKELGRNAAKLH